MYHDAHADPLFPAPSALGLGFSQQVQPADGSLPGLLERLHDFYESVDLLRRRPRRQRHRDHQHALQQHHMPIGRPHPPPRPPLEFILQLKAERLQSYNSVYHPYLYLSIYQSIEGKLSFEAERLRSILRRAVCATMFAPPEGFEVFAVMWVVESQALLRSVFIPKF